MLTSDPVLPHGLAVKRDSLAKPSDDRRGACGVLDLSSFDSKIEPDHQVETCQSEDPSEGGLGALNAFSVVFDEII